MKQKLIYILATTIIACTLILFYMEMYTDIKHPPRMYLKNYHGEYYMPEEDRQLWVYLLYQGHAVLSLVFFTIVVTTAYNNKTEKPQK